MRAKEGIRVRTLFSQLPAVSYLPFRPHRRPLKPSFVARGLLLDKCRVMYSKKKPLWLEFEVRLCEEAVGPSSR